MEYLIILLVIPVTQSRPFEDSMMPLRNNLRAPVVAELDVTNLNKELKEYIDLNVKDQINQTWYEKTEKAVKDSLSDLKSDILEKFEGRFDGLQQKIMMQSTSLEESLRKENKELNQNLTTEINQSQQRLTAQLKNLEDFLIKENTELKNNLTTENKKLNTDLRKGNAQLPQPVLVKKKPNENGFHRKVAACTMNIDNVGGGGYVVGDNFKASGNTADCSDLIGKTNKSGVYLIHPGESLEFKTYCDMETDGGGWTVFQRRINGLVDFYRDWNDYKNGFGDPHTEFWMGNSKLALMTSQRQYELRVNLEDFYGATAYAKYSTFSIGDESTKYKLTLNGYSGTAGDALKYHNNQAFSTKDRDNDLNVRNCAVDRTGAWWYNSCNESSLNGMYVGNRHVSNGINWWLWTGHLVKTTSMMIRRKRI